MSCLSVALIYDEQSASFLFCKQFGKLRVGSPSVYFSDFLICESVFWAEIEFHAVF